MPADTHTNLVADLTPPQREAVECTEGPLLILAAAGSGKTRVITRRIAFLLSMGVPAWQILALTFTNKAAGEMRERVGHMLENHPELAPLGPEKAMRGLTVTTFHALCARLMRRYADSMEGRPHWRIRSDFTIYDSDDQLALMKKTLKAMELATTNWPPRSILAAISNSKNEMVDCEQFLASASDFHSRTVAKVWQRYERAMRDANAVDFDDLLALTVRMLRESDFARSEVQGRWKYLMIDEYQDTNRVQFLLSTLLVGRADAAPAADIEPLPGEEAPEPTAGSLPPNVCVVGDPDQSIYGWRGADIRNILEFEEHYPGTRVIALGQNFRSSPEILATADALIRHNTRRKHKDLYTEREGGEKPTVVLCRDEHHEGELVVDWFSRLVEGKDIGPVLERITPIQWKDCAVFYRNNALSRVMEDAFRKAGIPYVIARGTAFYQREEIKDVLAYLRVVANPADEVSLTRIINKPARKIGTKSLDQVASHADRQGITLFEAARHADQIGGVSTIAANALAKFVEMVDGWNGAGTFMGAEVSSSLTELVERVIKEAGIEKYYSKYKSRATGEIDPEKLDNIEELVSAAAEFEQEFDPSDDPAMVELPGQQGETVIEEAPAPPLLAMLRAYLESVALVADADKVDPDKGAVTLMTLHAAKGLEFPAVAMIGLEEGLLPGMRAMDSEESIEEERRLAFVGITRAMHTLMITSARYRTHRGMRERSIPSRFLSELPAEHIIASDQADEWPTDDDFLAGDEPSGAFDDYEFDQRDPEEIALERQARRADQRARQRAMPRSSGKTEVKVGALVRHPQFGLGRVTKLMGMGMNRRASIEFLDVGSKTLVLQYARLSPVDTDAIDEPPF
jgi:DNA helicase-2/ATP-dependent DNA helicase PcrA